MTTTPILDLAKEPPAPRTPRWLVFVFSLAFGGVIGLLLGMVPAMHFRNLPNFNGFLLLPAFYVSVAVHEVGHLLVGTIVGMQPGGISVGGFRFFKSGDSWQSRFELRRAFAGGFAKVLPPIGDYRLSAFAWMVAGGPIASLLLAFIAGLLAVKFDFTSWNWTGTLSWISAVLVLVSLLPYSGGVNKSDGARLLALARNPKDCRAWMALLALQTQETGGTLPRDWNLELFTEVMKTEPASSQYPYVQLLSYFRSADQDNEEAGFEYLENALAASAKSGKCFRHALFLVAACVTAYPRGDTAGARVWLERARVLQKPKSTASIESAIAMSEHRYSDALQHLAATRAHLYSLKLNSGLARHSADQITAYEKICTDALRNQDIARPSVGASAFPSAVPGVA